MMPSRSRRKALVFAALACALGAGTFFVARPRPQPAPAAPTASATAGETAAAPSATATSHARARAAAPAPTVAPTHALRDDPETTARWRRRLTSSDPRERADGVDEIPGSPSSNGEAELARLVTADPDRHVRERAIFAYTAVAGPRAAPLLKQVALESRDEVLGAAARANLWRLREANPPPERAALTVSPRASILKGQPFDVGLSLVSDVDVPDARIELALPPGVELAGGEPTVYRGPLRARTPRAFTARLKVTRDALDARVRVLAKLDYPEELDVDRLRQVLHVSVKGGTGTSFLAPSD